MKTTDVRRTPGAAVNPAPRVLHCAEVSERWPKGRVQVVYTRDGLWWIGVARADLTARPSALVIPDGIESMVLLHESGATLELSSAGDRCRVTPEGRMIEVPVQVVGVPSASRRLFARGCGHVGTFELGDSLAVAPAFARLGCELEVWAFDSSNEGVRLDYRVALRGPDPIRIDVDLAVPSHYDRERIRRRVVEACKVFGEDAGAHFVLGLLETRLDGWDDGVDHMRAALAAEPSCERGYQAYFDGAFADRPVIVGAELWTTHDLPD